MVTNPKIKTNTRSSITRSPIPIGACIEVTELADAMIVQGQIPHICRKVATFTKQRTELSAIGKLYYRSNFEFLMRPSVRSIICTQPCPIRPCSMVVSLSQSRGQISKDLKRK